MDLFFFNEFPLKYYFSHALSRESNIFFINVIYEQELHIPVTFFYE